MGIGVPMGLQCSITAIGSVIMQWAVNMLGSTAVAAVTAAGKTQNLLTVPLESVGTAMATYAGQNLGASRMDRVRKGTNSAMLIILVYGLASAFILHFTDVQIMGLFLDTAKEVDIVAMGRRVPLLEQCVLCAAGCADRLALQRSRGWASPRWQCWQVWRK